uniref:PH domain-containing protein n=2 Tax=Lygus hesperus TaxID=30085 RepID=A0A146M6R0_LYGHE
MIQKILSITDYIAKSAANIHARDKVVYIQETVFKSHIAIVDRSRKFIREGVLRLVKAKSAHTYTFYLFNDFIGWMDKGMFSSTFGGIMHIGGLRLAPYIPENSGVKHSFRVGNIITNVEWWIACDSEKTRERWIKDICVAIRDFYSLSGTSNTTNLSAANVTLTHILHPDEFEKMIKKKKYNDTRLVKLPPPGIPDNLLSQQSTSLLTATGLSLSQPPVPPTPEIRLNSFDSTTSGSSPPPIPSRSSITARVAL